MAGSPHGSHRSDGMPSPSGPPVPGKVQDEDEAAADAEAEARSSYGGQLSLAIDMSQVHHGDEDAYDNAHLASQLVISVPPPRIVAPPPKVKPPSWMAPPPPPAVQDEYDDESPLASEIGRPEDNIALEGLVSKTRLEEYLAIEYGMQRNCQSLPVTLALWLSFMVLVFFHGQAERQFECATFIEDAVASVVVPSYTEYDGTVYPELTFGNIQEVEDVMRWVEDGLVKMLGVDTETFEGQDVTTTELSKHGQLQEGAQVLVGFLRLAQQRGSSMEQDAGGNNASDCASLSEDLQTFYGTKCHPYPAPEGSLGKYGGENVSSFDDSFRPDADGNYVAWVEMGRSVQSIRDRFTALKANEWIDLNSRTLEIDCLMLAAKANIYSLVTIEFTLSREGYIKQTLRVKPQRGDIYTHWTHVFFDMVWFCSLLVLAGAIVAQLIQANNMGTNWLKACLRDPYTWLDFGCLCGGFALGVFFWFLMYALDNLMDKVVTVGGALPQFSVADAPQMRMIQMVYENRAYQEAMSELLDHFYWMVTQIGRHRLCCFWYSMALAMRLFKGLGGQPRIAVMLLTVAFTVDYLTHFAIAFILVLMSFTLGGYILFGEQLYHWSTAGYSCASLFNVLFGRFEYDELNSVAPYTAACWFWGVYLFAALLLLNILLASVVHRYVDVQKRLGETGIGLRQQISELIREVRFLQTYEGAQKSIPYDKLLRVLSSEDDLDPAMVLRLGRLRMDRRVRTRKDLSHHETDPKVDVKYLVDRGCDVSVAEHLIERCTAWCNRISMTTAPDHRLVVKVAKHMHDTANESKSLREKVRSRVNFAASSVDRIDLKHAKCVAVAKRVKKAQDIPAGWSEHRDGQGRKILRHAESGLTSWTLPRNMVHG